MMKCVRSYILTHNLLLSLFMYCKWSANAVAYTSLQLQKFTELIMNDRFIVT